MHHRFLPFLQAQRSRLLERWEKLLRAERVSTPMAHPDSLVFLMEWTLESLFRELNTVGARRRIPPANSLSPRQICVCGLNPLLGFFASGEQAIVEILFVSTTGLDALSPMERQASLAELKHALHAVARREIDSFCAVCQNKPRPAEKTAVLPPLLSPPPVK